MGEICVIGGGPAGSTFAARMAQLGHDVCLVERDRFPRSHLGESLSPGVLPLLESTGARSAVEAAGFPRVRNVHVKWDGDPHVREDPRAQGLLVDRGEFDLLLLQHARSLGVRVLQPARVRKWRTDNGRWLVDIDSEGTAAQIRADFIADASGRCSGLTGQRRQTARRTVAIYGYWRGSDLPRQPRIEAGVDSWYWGVPLPDRSYNTLIFVDVTRFRDSRAASLRDRFIELLGSSGLMDGCGDAQLCGAVQATDASPFVSSDVVGPSMMRVGEAALGIDPVSSSGVQKAIQTALAAAIVANTLLRRPESGEAAMRFYRSMLNEASDRHCRWAAEHYSTVAAQQGTKFWQERAAEAAPTERLRPRISADPNRVRTARLALSREAEILDVPCLDGDFVAVKPALRHPNLETSVIFAGGWEIVPLLRQVRARSTLPQILASWLDLVPPQAGIAIAKWLLNNRILIDGNAPEYEASDDFFNGLAEETRFGTVRSPPS